MKRIGSGILILALLYTLTCGAAAFTPAMAQPSGSRVAVDGTLISCAAYEIVTDQNGYANTYFKLRDVAAALSGTEAQFQVRWTDGRIELERGKPYTAVGGELAGAAVQPVPVRAGRETLYLDGVRVEIECYTIGQNNYIKLRDLGKLLGFGVAWDSSVKTISITTDWEPAALDVALAGEPVTLDPTYSTTTDGATILNHLFEGLMRWEDSGSLAPGVERVNTARLGLGQAAAYEKQEHEDGAVSYRFHLRDDIRWSDGVPVTAGDFVYSWRRLADPATSADYSYLIDMVAGWDAVNSGEAPVTALGVSAPDKRTFEVRLSYDCPYFLQVCAFPCTMPLREDVVAAAPAEWTYRTDTYVTNGPYRMAKWDHNHMIELQASNTSPRRLELGPDVIRFHLMDNPADAELAYGTGELDLTAGGLVPAGTKHTDLERLPYLGTYFIEFNVQAAPFDDVRVRKAFQLALDLGYLEETVLQNGSTPAEALVPIGITELDGQDFRAVGGSYWKTPETRAEYEANVAKARELLAEAGYPNGEGFPQVSYCYNTDATHSAIAEAIATMWSQTLGVELFQESQDWNIFLQTRRDGDCHMARGGWIADYDDPMSFLDLWTTGNSYNDARYSRPEYDALIQKAKSTSDSEARMALLHQAEDLLIGEDQVLLPLFYYTQSALVRQTLEGLYYAPLGCYFFGGCTKA